MDSRSGTTGRYWERVLIEAALRNLLRDPDVDEIRISRPLNGRAEVTYRHRPRLTNISFTLDLSGDEKISASPV